MSKIKIINIINYCTLFVVAIVLAILVIIFKKADNSYYSAIGCICAAGLLNMLFIIIKEASVLSYDTKRLYPIMHAGYVLVAVICYYCCSHLKHFDEYIILYWISLIIGCIIPIVVVQIVQKHLDKKEKYKTKGLKVLVNKK